MQMNAWSCWFDYHYYVIQVMEVCVAVLLPAFAISWYQNQVMIKPNLHDPRTHVLISNDYHYLQGMSGYQKAAIHTLCL